MQVLIGWNCFQRTSPDFETPKNWNWNHPKKPHDRHFSCVNACRLVDWGSMFPPFLSHFGLAPQTSSLGILDDFGTPVSAWFKGWNPKGFDKNTNTQRHSLVLFLFRLSMRWCHKLDIWSTTSLHRNREVLEWEAPSSWITLRIWVLGYLDTEDLCMYVYIYMYTYICVSLCIYTIICTYMSICINMSINCYTVQHIHETSTLSKLLSLRSLLKSSAPQHSQDGYIPPVFCWSMAFWLFGFCTSSTSSGPSQRRKQDEVLLDEVPRDWCGID